MATRALATGGCRDATRLGWVVASLSRRAGNGGGGRFLGKSDSIFYLTCYEKTLSITREEKQ